MRPHPFLHMAKQSVIFFNCHFYHMGPLHRLCVSSSPSDTKVVYRNFSSCSDCLHKIWFPLQGIILGCSWSMDFYGSSVQCRPQNICHQHCLVCPGDTTWRVFQSLRLPANWDPPTTHECPMFHHFSSFGFALHCKSQMMA